jgi:hypothetical protein
MSMPKTSVYEDDLPLRREDHIGGSRKVPSMKAETVAKRVHHPSHYHLRLGVLAAYATHEGGTNWVYGFPGQRPADVCKRTAVLPSLAKSHVGSFYRTTALVIDPDDMFTIELSVLREIEKRSVLHCVARCS